MYQRVELHLGKANKARKTFVLFNVKVKVEKNSLGTLHLQ